MATVCGARGTPRQVMAPGRKVGGHYLAQGGLARAARSTRSILASSLENHSWAVLRGVPTPPRTSPRAERAQAGREVAGRLNS